MEEVKEQPKDDSVAIQEVQEQQKDNSVVMEEIQEQQKDNSVAIDEVQEQQKDDSVVMEEIQEQPTKVENDIVEDSDKSEVSTLVNNAPRLRVKIGWMDEF
jgi:septal ring factor EnvC (AmiA/AmiB activator)